MASAPWPPTHPKGVDPQNYPTWVIPPTTLPKNPTPLGRYLNQSFSMALGDPTDPTTHGMSAGLLALILSFIIYFV